MALLIMIFYGVALSGVTVVRELLMPDVIDEDEIKTGFRREGVYYGVGTFVDRFSLALTGASTALIFGLTGFATDVTNPPHVILGVRFVIAALLILALLIFLVCMKFYPLGAEKVAEMRKTLDKLHKEKAKKGGEAETG